MHHKYLLLLLFTLSYNAGAQQLNVGLHLNPTLTVPVLGRTSDYDKEIMVSGARLGYNVGGNIGYTSRDGNINVETGLNIIQKSICFKGYVKTLGTGRNKFKIISNSTSFEIPFLASVNVYKHDRNDLIYKVYATAGLSYELYSADGYGSLSSQRYESFYLQREPVFDIPQSYDESRWMNLVFGFKINTVVRKLGLIDYGLTWHIPMAEKEGYHIESTVVDLYNKKEFYYKGDFRPRLSYIDVKLCYYFLNFDRSFRRIKYKKGEYSDYM